MIYTERIDVNSEPKKLNRSDSLAGKLMWLKTVRLRACSSGGLLPLQAPVRPPEYGFLPAFLSYHFCHLVLGLKSGSYLEACYSVASGEISARYLPVKTGARRSEDAAIPSLKSAVANCAS
jgi:hypothetical protein